MAEEQGLQLNIKDKVYALILAGGMGARIIQTAFIRSLIKKRKLADNNYPILVIDNTMIGQMVSAALKNQNIHGVQVPEAHQSWPQDPRLWPMPNGAVEHPVFIDTWRKSFQNYGNVQSMNDLIAGNWSRTYSIEYGFSLRKDIHQHKLKNDKKSFIGHLYGKTMGLEYDGEVQMLKLTQQSKDITKFINDRKKPFVLMHIGMDRNPQDYMAGINYKTFKLWSLNDWAMLVQKFKHKYNFVQVYAYQDNPEIPDVFSIKVDNLNPVLQMLQSPKCKFFMSIDNYLAHLAATIKKRGIVLWGSVSPYVWGWKENENIWNRHSCDTIACWRPGLFDIDSNGKSWVCDHYSCMRSITVDQVSKAIYKLEANLETDKNKGEIVL